MGKKTYKYDAFISYRHGGADQFVAENLHRQMEAFKLPANVAKKISEKDPEAKTKISRVFRDQEELPLATNLEDPIVEALKDSEWLIVICSPRLRESLWCKKEIETFIKLHDSEHVMAVLVEGEPSESFPEELLTREVTTLGENGRYITTTEPIEPLAADVRATNNSDRLKAIKSELLRLLAPMFNLEYDELRQRHRERRMKKIVTLSVGAAAICFLFCILSSFSAITISRQNKEISEKSLQIENQAKEIETQNDELKINQSKNLAADSLALLKNDDRNGAIKLAYDALTEYDGISMPYTDEARYALEKSLNLYDVSGSSRADFEIKTGGIIKEVFTSPKKSLVLIYDSSDTMTIYSMEKLRVIDTFAVGNEALTDDDITFKDDETFYYAGVSDIYEYSTATGSNKMVVEGGFADFIYRIRYNASNNMLLASMGDKLVGYDADTFEVIKEYPLNDDEMGCRKIRFLNDDIIVVPNEIGDDCVVRLMDLEGDTLARFTYTDEYYENAYLRDNDLYVLTSKTNRINNVLSGGSSVIRAYSLDNNKLKWSRDDKNLYGYAFCEIEEDDGIFLVEIGKKGIIEVDETNGELIVSDLYADGNIIWAGSTNLAATYMTTKPMIMYLTSHTTMGFNGTIDCNLSKPAKAQSVAGGYFIGEENSNRLVFYSEFNNEDIEEYDGILTVEETKNLSEIADEDEIRKIGLTTPELIRNIAFDQDGQRMCVTGKDQVARLYDASTKELLNTWELDGIADIIKEYLGTDNDGNTYWASDVRGYCLSSDNKLIAEFDYLRGVDKDNDLYIFGLKNSDDKYSAPIYKLEDMLSMAKKRLRL